MFKNIIPLTLVLIAVSGCSLIPNAADEPVPPAGSAKMVALVAPELDYSDETPDCVTAGQRIAAHIEVGMTLEDVRRLVGNPRWDLPGQWWWSASFSETGRPRIKFPFGRGLPDVKVTGVQADTDRC